MLVRDVSLIRAIIDLIDNSVDGAHHTRPDGPYDGYWIEIDTDPEKFQIRDNCGGISREARVYAFRFGRPSEVPMTSGSIGQFGVGMKRTLFKLGNHFRVRSATPVDRFVVEDDVGEWMRRKEWEFKITTSSENLPGPNEAGTEIDVTELHEPVAAMFGLENWKTQLRDELETAHALSLGKGLRITLNGKDIGRKAFMLLSSEEIQPSFKQIELPSPRNKDVIVRIYAGVAKHRDLKRGGWSIFCNGRMVQESDQTALTGWGSDEGENVPKYHPDFAYFRGYVFFDSDNPSKLPWTTTKTGVDSDSAVYKAARLEMMKAMKPITSFLRALAGESSKANDAEEASTPLADAMGAGHEVPYSEIRRERVFAWPSAPKQKSEPPNRRIVYERPREQVATVMKKLGARTLREVGEQTFDYYWQAECEE